jgi:poly(A) polymerase
VNPVPAAGILSGMTEREFAADVVVRLQAAGHRALWAGGCVRDELLGLTPADYDVATDARPEQVKALFRRCHSFGASFGVVEVLGPRGPDGEWLKVQVATFRSDGAYTDGRHPDSVTFSSPEEDAKRRDFTINGMFFDPVARQVIDYVGGQADLAAKVLRAIGDPAERFSEDKLRILRAVRMAARFELAIDPATFDAARRMAPEIRAVSAERIAEELRKTLTNRHRARGFRLLREIELVPQILPELADGPTWDRIVRVLEAFPPAVSFPLAFAAVLQSLGPATAAEVCRRLRLSNAELERVAWLVTRKDVLRGVSGLRPSRWKPILAHPEVLDLIALHRANAIADGQGTEEIEFCERHLRETPAAELNPPPLLTGDDLRALGLTPGPEFKRLLDAVREAQLDGTIRTKDEALALVQRLRASG